MLHNAVEEALGWLLRAEQDQVDVLVPTKQQAFGQDSNPHHSLQGSGQSYKEDGRENAQKQNKQQSLHPTAMLEDEKH